MRTVEERFNSIFPIKNVDNLGYRLERYNVGHRLLEISVNSGGEKLFDLLFAGTWYISCPARWQGGNLELGSSSKCKEVLIFAGYHSVFADEGRAYLFELTQPRNFVQIVAGSIERIDTK